MDKTKVVKKTITAQIRETSTIEECYQGIKETAIKMIKWNTVQNWYIGGMVDRLIELEATNVIENVCELIDKKRRHIHYCHAFYKKCPDLAVIEEICQKGFKWKHFKMMTEIKEDDNRRLLETDIIEGEIVEEDIIEKINEIKREEIPPEDPNQGGEDLTNTQEDNEGKAQKNAKKDLLKAASFFKTTSTKSQELLYSIPAQLLLLNKELENSICDNMLDFLEGPKTKKITKMCEDVKIARRNIKELGIIMGDFFEKHGI